MPETAVLGPATEAGAAVFPIALFANRTKPEGRQLSESWEQLAARLGRHSIRREKDGPAWSPTRYRPDAVYRDAENVVSLTLLVQDVDDGTSLDELRPGIDEYEWLAYTTHSHTAEHPKYRIVYPLLSEVPVDSWAAVWAGAFVVLGGGHIDRTCKNVSRLYYWPSCPMETRADKWAVANHGRFVDPAEMAAHAPPAPLPGVRRSAGGRISGEGDYATLDAVAWFEHHGAYGKPLSGTKHAVECPWIGEHTQPSRAEDSDTVIWEGGAGRWPTFFCAHAHCLDRGIREVLAYWSDADAFCSAVFQRAAKFEVPPGHGDEDAPPFSLNGAHPVGAMADGWDEPLPLYGVVLPTFPVRAFTPWLANMVESVATATQTPPDLAAMLALSVLATAAQKRCEALVRDGWREVLSLWTVTALPPGNRKSPAYAPMVVPVVDYERELVMLTAPDIAAARTEYEVSEGALKRLKDQAIKAKSEFERDQLTREATKLAERLQEMKVPVSPRLMVDDATPEKLGMLLHEHFGRMAILSPEGDVFDLMAGKYSSGTANIGLYLRGHSGDDLIVDRVGRPAIVVRRAAITFGLTVQPDVLVGLTSNSTFRGRGLLGRLLYSLPKSTLGDRQIRPAPVPEAVSAGYASRMHSCLSLSTTTDDEGQVQPRLINFDPAADDAVADFERWIEPLLKPGRELGYIADWAGKLAGQMARIATLLHVAEMAGSGDPWLTSVDAETVICARLIAEYLIPHAKAAFQAMGTDPALNGAKEILEWLKERGKLAFQKRDVHRGLQTLFPRSEDIDGPLVLLCDHGYLRQVSEPARQGAGRPPSPGFEVHPSVLN